MPGLAVQLLALTVCNKQPVYFNRNLLDINVLEKFVSRNELVCIVFVLPLYSFMTSIQLYADYVYNAIDALPSTAHPMTQFASGVMALQVWISKLPLLFACSLCDIC